MSYRSVVGRHVVVKSKISQRVVGRTRLVQIEGIVAKCVVIDARGVGIKRLISERRIVSSRSNGIEGIESKGYVL